MGAVGHPVMQTFDDAAGGGFAQGRDDRVDQCCTSCHRKPTREGRREAHMREVALIYTMRVTQKHAVQEWGCLHDMLLSLPGLACW